MFLVRLNPVISDDVGGLTKLPVSRTDSKSAGVQKPKKLGYLNVGL